jgi:hypothetical protein
MMVIGRPEWSFAQGWPSKEINMIKFITAKLKEIFEIGSGLIAPTLRTNIMGIGIFALRILWQWLGRGKYFTV